MGFKPGATIGSIPSDICASLSPGLLPRIGSPARNQLHQHSDSGNHSGSDRFPGKKCNPQVEVPPAALRGLAAVVIITELSPHSLFQSGPDHRIPFDTSFYHVMRLPHAPSRTGLLGTSLAERSDYERSIGESGLPLKS